MIKAVIFDIDGVLLDSMKANIKFFRDLLEASGYKKPSKKSVSKIFHLSMLDGIKLLTQEKSEKKIEEVWKLGHKFPYPSNLLKIPNDMPSMIKLLGHKYKLAIVTSRIKRGVDVFFKISKMKKYFVVIVSFENSSKHKPYPEPLLVALRRLKIKSEEAVYIGDAESDMKAAKSAGVKFILYSQNKLSGADIQVNSFKEIPAAIEHLIR